MSTTNIAQTSDGASSIPLYSQQNVSSSALQNIFLTVPSELLRRIVYFLHPSDALIFTSSDVLEKRVNVSALRPKALPALRADDRFFYGDVPQPYEPRIHFPCDISNIHSITVRTQWKDQGWGNQKGGLFIVATPKASKLDVAVVPAVENDATVENANETLEDPFEGGRVVAETAICAPHEWGHTELTFSPVESEYYYIWYRVGGGGGHTLFLKDVEVVTFMFDDHNFTYMKTFECLHNAGCFNSEIIRAPTRSNNVQRWTRLGRREAAQPIFNQKVNKSDLFYPMLLLNVCRSIQRTMAVTEECNVASQNSVLFHTLQFLSDSGIPIDKHSLFAMEEIIQTDINEGDTDWKIYEANCRNLRQRHNLNDENGSLTDDHGVNQNRGIPIPLRHAHVNGFRMVMTARREVPDDDNSDDEQENNGDENDVIGNGIRIIPILPPQEGENLTENNDAAIPQVINNPDGTFTINLGNLDDLAARAEPLDDADLNNHQRGMDGGPPDENNLGNEEMFGIARAAMAAVFGFQNDNGENLGNNNNNNTNNDDNNNNNNMNGGFPMGGFQNFFQQVNGGRGGAVGGGVFVAGGNNNNNNMNFFVGGDGDRFPFQNIIDLAINANNPVQQQHQADPTVPVNDHGMTDVDNDDDDAEEVPIM